MVVFLGGQTQARAQMAVNVVCPRDYSPTLMQATRSHQLPHVRIVVATPALTPLLTVTHIHSASSVATRIVVATHALTPLLTVTQTTQPHQKPHV